MSQGKYLTTVSLAKRHSVVLTCARVCLCMCVCVSQGKYLTSVSLAKRHSVVLTSDGEPYTWGHQLVTPRRVQLANTRDVSRAVPAGGDDQIRFHKGHTEVVRPVAVSVTHPHAHTHMKGMIRYDFKWDRRPAYVRTLYGAAQVAYATCV